MRQHRSTVSQCLAEVSLHLVALVGTNDDAADHYQHDWQFPGVHPLLCHDQRRTERSDKLDISINLQHVRDANGSRDSSSYRLPYRRPDHHRCATPRFSPQESY